MCPLAIGLGSTFNETVSRNIFQFQAIAHNYFLFSQHFTYYKEAIDYITITKGAYALLDVRDLQHQSRQ